MEKKLLTSEQPAEAHVLSHCWAPCQTTAEFPEATVLSQVESPDAACRFGGSQGRELPSGQTIAALYQHPCGMAM